MNEIEIYIRSLAVDPNSVVLLTEFRDGFYAWLAADARRYWPRHRVINELNRRGFAVSDLAGRATIIRGLSLPAPVAA